MKKFFFFLMLTATSIISSAQILRVEGIDFYDYVIGVPEHRIFLSNGEILGVKNNPYKTTCLTEVGGNKVEAKVDFNPQKIKKGTMIEKKGQVYSEVSIKKITQKKIKYAKIRQVSSEFIASLSGCFSYQTFLSVGAGKARVNGKSSGGTKTVVNIVFTDNSYACIEASDDPIWLEAAPDMMVEYYKCGTYNIYKLLFE